MDKQEDQWCISYISENAHKESLLQTDLKPLCVMNAVKADGKDNRGFFRTDASFLCLYLSCQI